MGNEFTYKNLEDIEATRREIIRRQTKPFYKNIFYVHGAAVVETIFAPLFLLTIFLYAIVRIRMYTAQLEVQESKGNIGTLGNFLTFFQAILLTQTYGRYWEQFIFLAKPIAHMFNMSLMLMVLPRKPAIRILRYVLGAYAICFCYCSETYTVTNFFNHVNKKWNLLTDKEMKRVNKINANEGGYAFREIIGWAMQLVEMHRKNGELDMMQASEIRTAILGVRAVVSTLGDYAAQPIPYFFYYFMDAVAFLYLPLFAISTGYANKTNDAYSEYTALVAVLVNTFFICGLREIFRKLADPIGDDVEDLCVLTYTNAAVDGCFAIISAPELPEECNEEELDEQRRKHLIDAFDHAKATKLSI